MEETVSNAVSEETIAVNNGDSTDTFQKVKSKKTSKRKRDQGGEVQMESEDAVAPKRPQFPPISGDRLKVTNESSKKNIYISICTWCDLSNTLLDKYRQSSVSYCACATSS